MVAAFHKNLMGENGSFTRCSAMFRHKNKNLNAEKFTNAAVLHG